MSTVYIDHAGYQLEKCEGTLCVRDAEGHILRSLPIRRIERLYLQGDQQLHTGLLLALLEHGTEIVFLSPRKGYAIGQVLGPRHNDASIRLQQYAWSIKPERCLTLARIVVRSKLLAQKRVVLHSLRVGKGDRALLLSARQRLNRHLDSIPESDMPELLGLEGSAAAAYFSAYFSTLPLPVQPKERRRRPPPDPANALLSLGYTLLLKEAVHVAHAHGLDPHVGFYHTLSFGRESLACDLIEPLRAQVEIWVRHLFVEKLLREESFAGEAGISCQLGKSGRSVFYREWAHEAPKIRQRLRHYVRHLVRQLRRELHNG